MKGFLFGFLSLLVCVSTANARFSERKLESSMASAAKSGKLVAFVFYQEYALPNCPKCVSTTNANNKALKSAIPRSDVVVIEVEADDKDIAKLPSVVGSGNAPRIVVTDSQCTKVVAELNGAPDRAEAKAFEDKVGEARAGN